MQEIPSYVVSDFDDDTLSLMRELDALGGDAKIFNAEAHAIVAGSDDDNNNVDSTNQTLWINNNRVGYRNTSISKTEPSGKRTLAFSIKSLASAILPRLRYA